MSSIIFLSALVLGVVGIIAAVIIFFVSKAFYVYEDPRIEQVADKLPGANCGGCGFAGCKG
ncbi:MAG: ferredoxin, partial [Lentimicrobiaceae bacterium]|nr:ferredoxin [Lentimicrobiaceae bacterium]